MKIRIDIQDVHETVQAPNAAGVLQKVKAEAASRAPFLMKAAIRAMPDMTFAAEAVKHHNRNNKSNDPAPSSPQAFLDWAVSRGYVTIVEE